ncbi:MAG: class I SAM-dependent methyltransferase [Gammaproteobacteria bacterium]|nr:class I SAM-dependent methyltransferase [Gammaproteobacteria bacterium]
MNRVERPDAPAARRNQGVILAVLADEFRDARSVLEIGSGTGQHAVHFAAALPGLQWQTSDRKSNHDGINAWITSAKLGNVAPPLDLDVLQTSELRGEYDAVYSANTAHIMSIAAVLRMFELVGRILPADGLFCLYGPFNIDGKFTSESNEQFDRSLRMQDPDMGIRDLTELDQLAARCGLVQVRRYAMPANNMLVVWQKQGSE